MTGFENWKADVFLGVVGNVAFAVLGAVVVLVFAWLRTFLFGGRRQLARMLGASALNPSVEIIVSNLYMDGAKYRAQGCGVLEKGFVGATVSQPEIEAAIAIRDRLTRTELPFVDEWGSRRLSGVKVRIRPSDHDLHTEAARGFQDPRHTYRRVPRAIVVIGSPAYNRACYEVLGPTLDDTDGAREAESAWPPSTEGQVLLGASRFHWVRRRLSSVPSPVKRLGERVFQVEDGDLDLLKARHPHPERVQYEQSFVQQIHVPYQETEAKALRGLTVTVFAGVGAAGTAEAVKSFLNGPYSWRWLRRQVRAQRRASSSQRPGHAVTVWARHWSWEGSGAGPTEATSASTLWARIRLRLRAVARWFLARDDVDGFLFRRLTVGQARERAAQLTTIPVKPPLTGTGTTSPGSAEGS